MAMAVDSPSQKPGGAAVLDKAPERVRKRSPRYKNPDVAARLHREALDAQLAPRQGRGHERRALETLAIRLTLACAG